MNRRPVSSQLQNPSRRPKAPSINSKKLRRSSTSQLQPFGLGAAIVSKDPGSIAKNAKLVLDAAKILLA